MDDDLSICPLDSNTYKFRQSAPPMGSSHIPVIENHVSTNDCVHCPHPPLKEFIFDGRLMGTTPLLLACHYGKFDSVKRIVESWGVDVRSAATYYPQPSRAEMGLMKKIESTTPLFVAAFQGHSKIVRYLLEKGADVTVTTSDKAKLEYDGLTPLNGALPEHWMPPHHWSDWCPLDTLRRERHAIVLSLLEFGADISASQKPLWMSNRYILCGVDTTMTLINHGMDVKQRDPTSGRTVLHHWARPYHDCTEKDSLTIVKLLIEKGADVMARDNSGFTPIMTAANSLGLGYGSGLELALLDFLLERDDIVIMEKIEAMELAGAKLFSFPRNSSQFHKACYYWRRASHLRQTDGSYQKKLTLKSVDTVEWTTANQLEHLIQQQTECEIKMQSLLVQLRILSSRSCWESVLNFLKDYMCNSDSYLKEMRYVGMYPELLDIYWALLETILLFKPSEKGIWNMSVSFVSTLIYTLYNAKSFNSTLLNVEMIKKSIHLILATDQFRLADGERETETEISYSRAIFTFLTMLLGLPEMLDNIWESLIQLFRHIDSDELGSLLLPACEDYKNAHYTAPIRLLLQLGANVDAFDRNGNRPLHLVAQADSGQSEAAGCLLLGYGAQLHRTNNSGKTAVDLWIERNEREDDHEREGAAEPFGRPDWCRTVRKLKCLSACCIRVHHVSYEDEPEFFQDSHSFIKKH